MTALLAVLALAAPVHAHPHAHPTRWHVVAPYNAKLNRMAECESGGNPEAVSPGGRFRGLLQFDVPTWRSVGGRRLPDQNSALEQKYRAVLLIRRRGFSPWPVCRYA